VEGQHGEQCSLLGGAEWNRTVVERRLDRPEQVQTDAFAFLNAG
jgi:hypothetical protein